MPNINDFDRLYRRTKLGVGVTNETVRLSLGPVASGKLRVLTHVTVENTDHAFDKCRLGVNAGGRDHYLDEITTVSVDELCVSRSDILLMERDIFFAEFTGTEDGNRLIMTCAGWTKDLK